VNETLEHTARRIADQGREALLSRLRPAFEQAAAAHADVLKLDEERLEQMIQQAADRADGLQWRRALASVATEQLGIGLGEALNHPAVERAHALVGAPSYEDSLAELGHRRPADDREPAAEESAPAPGDGEPESAAAVHEPEPTGADEDEAAVEPPPAPVAAGAPEVDGEEEGADRPVGSQTAEWEAREDEEEDEYEEYEEYEEPPPVGSQLDAEPDTLRLRAVHLGGVANLAPAADDIELWLSGDGLDIVRGPAHTPLGRLTWKEIAALDVPPPRGRMRRKRVQDAHLVVRGEHGAASFEVPGVAPEELRKHLAPLLERHK
jgi:hypothetical protein